MRAGKLRHTAKIYKASSTLDEFGACSTDLELYRTVKAGYVTRKPREVFASGNITYVEYVITVRHTPALVDLPSSAEVEVDGKRLKVLSVRDPKGMDRMLEILCEERA